MGATAGLTCLQGHLPLIWASSLCSLPGALSCACVAPGGGRIWDKVFPAPWTSPGPGQLGRGSFQLPTGHRHGFSLFQRV